MDGKVENNKALKPFPQVFYIEKLNLIIEIKSSYWYKVHEERIILKEKATIDEEFDYVIIINKNYDEFKKYVDKLNLIDK